MNSDDGIVDAVALEESVNPFDTVSTNETSDNAIVIHSFGDVVASVINDAQFAILQGKTPKSAILKRPGKGGKTFSYVSHGYVTSTLNKAFGFDWDFETIPNGNGDMFTVMESRTEKDDKGKEFVRGGSVLVTGKLTVRIHDPKDPSVIVATISKTATGEKELIKGMTWGGLVKSAESDALKKAASRLGVALDLYWQDVDQDYIDMQAQQKEVEQKRIYTQRLAEVASMLSEGKTPFDIADKLTISLPEAFEYIEKVTKDMP